MNVATTCAPVSLTHAIPVFFCFASRRRGRNIYERRTNRGLVATSLLPPPSLSSSFEPVARSAINFPTFPTSLDKPRNFRDELSKTQEGFYYTQYVAHFIFLSKRIEIIDTTYTYTSDRSLSNFVFSHERR